MQSDDVSTGRIVSTVGDGDGDGGGGNKDCRKKSNGLTEEET